MPSERVQRRIDAALDQAVDAFDEGDWRRVREFCDRVLRLDPENEVARGFLDAANRDTGTISAVSSTAATDPPIESAKPATEHPASFGGDRYEVRRFLGKGGKKRVFLADDTRLDRNLAPCARFEVTPTLTVGTSEGRA